MKQTADKIENPQYRVGVQHRTAGKIYPCLAKDDQYSFGNQVVIKGEHGTSVAKVVEEPKEASAQQVKSIKNQLLHLASQSDLDRDIAFKEKALSYMSACEKKITERQLPMKLTDAEMSDNGKKVVFIFYAEQRVDFRSLVKELASELRTRIEMRQIGARDETKYKGCLGACGQITTCCSTFLRSFKSISIAMAKNQGLSPNPSKLTGMCGKLKCCLAYENEQYSKNRKGLFKIGAIISTPKGSGKIRSINILKKTYTVNLDEGSEEHFNADECSTLDATKKVARERVMKQKQAEYKRRETQQRERLEKRQQKRDAIASTVKKKEERRQSESEGENKSSQKPRRNKQRRGGKSRQKNRKPSERKPKT